MKTKLEDRLKLYATVATSVTTAVNLNAQVEYNKMNPDEVLGMGSTLMIDVNEDGQTDFQISVNGWTSGEYGSFIYGEITPYGSNAVGASVSWFGSYYYPYGYYGTYYYPYYGTYSTYYDGSAPPTPGGTYSTSYYYGSYYYDTYGYYSYYGYYYDYYGYYSYPVYYALGLDEGEIINGSMSFGWSYAQIFSNYDTGMVGKGDKYIPFQLFIDGNVHFGWIRVEVSADGKQITVKDAAYAEKSGASIEAGQKK